MKPAREIISRELIDDLWGAGYTILPRARHPDPFFVPPEMVPQGRSYQWMHLIQDRIYIGNAVDHSDGRGWAPVQANRHDGYFMPTGFVGDIEVNGLGLFEKPKFEVDEERAASIQKAKDAADPVKFFADKGFDGHIKVNSDRTEIGATKTIEDTTKIPRELTPYIAQILQERDRIYSDVLNAFGKGSCDTTHEENVIISQYFSVLDSDPTALKGPTLNAIILPFAIENIRKRIAEEATNGQVS
jgi:hypothetical protein